MMGRFDQILGMDKPEYRGRIDLGGLIWVRIDWISVNSAPIKVHLGIFNYISCHLHVMQGLWLGGFVHLSYYFILLLNFNAKNKWIILKTDAINLTCGFFHKFIIR